jgi:O-antigen ligase
MTNVSTKKEEILLWLVLAFVFFIPLSAFVSVRVLLIALVLSLFMGRQYVSVLSRSWDIAIYFLVLAAGLLYSDDISAGLRILETSASLFAAPLIFVRFSSFDDVRVRKIFYAFGLGLLLSCITSLVWAVVRYLNTGDTLVFFHEEFTSLLGFQPTYVAYYIILAITYGLYSIFYTQGSIRPFWLVIITAFLFAILLLTGGHTAFIGFMLIAAFFVLKFLTGPLTRRSAGVVGLCLVMLVTLFFASRRVGTERGQVMMDDGWDRYVLWESAIRATPNLLGVGTGDYKTVIENYYRSKNLTQYADETFNAHNQFIQSLFANGLPGVLSLMILLLRPIYLCSRDQNVIGVLTLFPFIVYAVTEVFLGRYQGVVIYATIQQIWITYHYNLKTDLETIGQVSMKSTKPVHVNWS